MIFKEEEIFIIGQFGLEDHHFNHMQMLLDHSTVSLERKLYQFGKQLLKPFKKKTEHTNQVFFYHTKSITVNSEC